MRPRVAALDDTLDLLPTQAAALKQGWAALYITLRGGPRPYLHVSLGPNVPRFTPRGYTRRTVHLLVPRSLELPAPSGAPPGQRRMVI